MQPPLSPTRGEAPAPAFGVKRHPVPPTPGQKQHPRGHSRCHRGIYLPVINVIIFATPAPVIVWKPIDLCELLFAQGRHTSKILIVRQTESKKKKPLEERC